MIRTNDPVRDAESYNVSAEEIMGRLPECVDCGEPIQQETALLLEGKWRCDDCINFHRKEVGA